MTRPVSPHATSTDLVLHALRCIGFSGLAAVAAATGLPESDVESELIDLAVAGLVTHMAGPFGGWGITDAGRAEDARRITEELDAAGAPAVVTEAFNGFLVLNPELLDLCTAWQTRSVDGSTTLNDHTDKAYDARVLDRLADLDQRADAVCTELSGAMRRFQRYRSRLAHALTRANAGELDYDTDGTAPYHTVWFQLHEDLLATLGRPRN
ncbi:transcriptional regulator [Kitasatospora sp. NPDC101155]|uniref:transcriptional regulator n=1 Tax=Kitasatospora sp. NPDC101155 TaxID=3364097 RepID=UPI00382B4087